MSVVAQRAEPRIMAWLVPAAGPERDHIAATIDRLAREHAAPSFAPHVTLVTSDDLAAQAAVRTLRSLATATPALDLTFAAVEHEQAYFRCLYLVAERSSQLMAMHEAGLQSWAQDHSAYRPHLSLLYSDMPAAHKPAIISGINIAMPVTIRFDAVELWASDQSGVSDWRRVAGFALQGRPGDGA